MDIFDELIFGSITEITDFTFLQIIVHLLVLLVCIEFFATVVSLIVRGGHI